MKTRINAKLKKHMNSVMFKVLKPTYFSAIPMDSMFGVMQEFGLVPLQEDGTFWDGFLCGRSATCFIPMGFVDNTDSEGFYTPVDNSGLRLSWYKMESGRYEVTAYFT